MRRLFAFLALGALTALAIGSAAALGVNGGTIQAGEDLDLTCDPDGVQVDGWGLESNTGLVNRVRIVGISDACQGNALFVKVTSNGSIIGSGSVDPLGSANTGGGGQVAVNFNPVAAASITDIHVYIEGPAGAPG